MASLSIFSADGKEVGKYDIAFTDLVARINKQLLHDAVIMYQANLRQGTKKTKSRAEVSATTKKMYRQKGTGNARAGSRASGIRRGGGHIFAIRPRDYSYRLPRKALQLATRMAIAAKLRDGEVVLIDKLNFDQPKTKDMATILGKLGCAGNSLLIATADQNKNVYMSGRNIDRVSVSHVADLNAHVILKARRLLLTKDALDRIKSNATAKAGSAAITK